MFPYLALAVGEITAKYRKSVEALLFFSDKS